MLARERRTGVLETQIDDAPREPIDSGNEDIDMSDLEENLFAGNIASSPSESMRTKDLSQRQRDVLQNIINQTPRCNSRTLLMTLDERVAAMQACKYVTEVIPAARTIINEDFMTTHAIDMVFHGHVEAEDHLY